MTGILFCCNDNYALCVTHIKKIDLQLGICKPHVYRNRERIKRAFSHVATKILVLSYLPNLSFYLAAVRVPLPMLQSPVMASSWEVRYDPLYFMSTFDIIFHFAHSSHYKLWSF